MFALLPLLAETSAAWYVALPRELFKLIPATWNLLIWMIGLIHVPSMIYLGVVLTLGFLLTHRVIPKVVVAILRALGREPKLTPMMRRRIERFKTIRRGYYSFLLITTLFIVSLFLELIVNGKALYIHYDGKTSFPAVTQWVSTVVPFVEIPHYRKASDYGLDGDGPVDYRRFQRYMRNPALMKTDIARIRAEVIELQKKQIAKPEPVVEPVEPKKPGPNASEDEIAKYEDDHFEWEMAAEEFRDSRAALEKDFEEKNRLYTLKQNAIDARTRAADQLEKSYPTFAAGKCSIILPLYPYGPEEKLLDKFEKPPPIPPHDEHPLGLTDNGSDVLCQIVYGFRVALTFALIVASIGYSIGVVVGGLMGYYGGWTDILVQRFIEIWGSVPFLFTMMIIASIIRPNILILALMMIILRSWIGITYTIRGEFYREKARDYVQAAISIGVSDWKIIIRHILPNSLVPLVTFAPFGIVAYIGSLVSLDYLGFGLPPGTPSWGGLLQQGQTYITKYPFLIFIPSAAFAGTLFCVVMIGEAVREGFDPKVFSRLR